MFFLSVYVYYFFQMAIRLFEHKYYVFLDLIVYFIINRTFSSLAQERCEPRKFGSF